MLPCVRDGLTSGNEGLVSSTLGGLSLQMDREHVEYEDELEEQQTSATLPRAMLMGSFLLEPKMPVPLREVLRSSEDDELRRRLKIPPLPSLRTGLGLARLRWKREPLRRGGCSAGAGAVFL